MKMRLLLLLVIAGLLSATAASAAMPKEDVTLCAFTIDLTKAKDDRLPVEMTIHGDLPEAITYYLPAIVPGTYEVYDFGRFISGFQAFDKKGKALRVSHPDKNSWKIEGAKDLHRISYWVEDTWDTEIGGEEDRIFEPAGTNIQADSNFIINTHGFCGYFENMKNIRFQIDVIRPDGFYGSTSLKGNSRGNTDSYYAASYADLIDAPVMYCRPDTTHISVGGCDVLISVYSPQKLISSKFVAGNLRDLLGQQKEYLGGQLPVDRYTFIIYLSSDGFRSGSLGALEHSYSSVYCLPEMTEHYIGPKIRDLAAHEFFHIVTPLSIHSEEIGNFDYNHPSMSQHLWLYEGLTEYAAGLVQVKYGTMTMEQYLKLITEKMRGSARYQEDLAFTEMSKGVLDKYKNQYGNVYQKGMLIGMCLDLRLRQLSEGRYGVQELMRDLAKSYGKNQSFKDDELIGRIIELTYPEIGDFFNRYVSGKERLPFEELLGLAGFRFTANHFEKRLDPFGGYNYVIDEDNGKVILLNLGRTSAQAQLMGYREGDVVRSINGKKIGGPGAASDIAGIIGAAKENDKLKVVIERKNELGRYEEVTLKGHFRYVENFFDDELKPEEKPTAAQLALRKSWINK